MAAYTACGAQRAPMAAWRVAPALRGAAVGGKAAVVEQLVQRGDEILTRCLDPNTKTRVNAAEALEHHIFSRLRVAASPCVRLGSAARGRGAGGEISRAEGVDTGVDVVGCAAGWLTREGCFQCTYNSTPD